MRTVTLVLPAAATTPAADGFGKFESHVAVSPLTGAKLSQLPSAEGMRNRHVTPIVKVDSRFVRRNLLRANGKRGRRIVPGSLFRCQRDGIPSVEHVLRFINLVESDPMQPFETAGRHNG
jgi:hypothetical protein